MLQNTIYYFTEGQPDKLDRVTIHAEWIADNVGKSLNETGIRGQISFDAPSHFENNVRINGQLVVKIPKEQSKIGYVLRKGNWIKMDVKNWEPITKHT